MNTQILLASRPGTGLPSNNNFKIVSEPKQVPKDGEILVRVVYISLEPAMRGWMEEGRSYIPPVKIGQVMRAVGIGEVVESKHPNFKPGDIASGMYGWQSYAVVKGDSAMKGGKDFPMSILNMTGFTSYFGLLDVGKPKSGETVLISGAAGAVGQLAGQIAKIKGCRVVGIAGSADKCESLVKDYGFDAAINYKTATNLTNEIRTHCPKGVDVFFDNVGGDVLDAALLRLNMHARVIICGGISQYNNPKDIRGPKNYLQLLINRAKMEGFVVFDYASRFSEAISDYSQWLKEGKIRYKEHVVQGLENAPNALAMLFKGENQGKLLIKVTDEKAKL